MIVVAAVIALPKGMIISKMKKGVLSIGPCKELNDEKFKGPPRRAFLLFSRPSPACFGVFELSENSVISVRGSGMNSGGESVAMSYQDVLLGIKKQRTRVTLRYRIVPIAAASKLLGSTRIDYLFYLRKSRKNSYSARVSPHVLKDRSCQFPHFGRSP